jgi:CHASE3 domain sensor protein
MLAKGTFSRLPISSKMLIATIIPLCLFALLAMTSFYAIRSLEHSAKLVEQTHGVLANAAIIEKRLLELEVLRLGSIPSDKVDNVRRYLEIKESLFDKLAETERLVSASPAQVARIQAIRIELKGLLIDEGSLQKRTRVENEKKDNSVLKEVRASLGSFASVEKNLMKARKQESLKNSARSNTIIVIGTMLVIALSLAFSLLVIRLINRQLTKTTEIAERVAEGYYDIKIHLNNSSDRLGKSLQRMTHALKENATALNLEKEKLKAQDWIKSNHSDIIAKLQGLNDLGLFSEKLLNKLIPAINAHLGLFYFKEQHDENVTISLLSSYAFNNRKNLSNKYSLGEGLVGQCVLEKKAILLLEAPADYLEISSGSGRTLPKNILVTPIMFEHEVVAALEIASVCKIDDKSKALIELLTKSLGVLINNILSQKMTRDLLRQSQDLSEELQAQ